VRKIWAAGMFSDIGTWVQLIVVGSLVASDSGSALKTGLVAMATIMPPGLCAPIGGLLADRFDRRTVFIAGLTAQALVTSGLALAIASGVRNSWALSGIILVSSAVGSLANPAYSAMLPDLVPPQELMAMVALGIYSWNAGRIVGPLLAAAVGAAVGPAWTVLFNALTFAGMAIAVATVKQRFIPPATDAIASVRTRFVHGWRTLRSVPGCRSSMGLVILLNLTVAAFMGLIPIYASLEFDGGTGLAGTISATQGVGAIVGSVGVTMLAPRIGRARLIAGIIPLIVVAYVAYALAPTPLAAAAAAVFLGCGSSGLFVTSFSIAQRDAPDAERGRVLSLVQASMGGAYGFGVLWIAALGDATNLRVAFVVAAVLTAVGALGMARINPGWRPIVDGNEVTSSVTAHPAGTTTDASTTDASGTAPLR
jgi:MFS family permease